MKIGLEYLVQEVLTEKNTIEILIKSWVRILEGVAFA